MNRLAQVREAAQQIQQPKLDEHVIPGTHRLLPQLSMDVFTSGLNIEPEVILERNSDHARCHVHSLAKLFVVRSS